MIRSVHRLLKGGGWRLRILGILQGGENLKKILIFGPKLGV